MLSITDLATIIGVLGVLSGVVAAVFELHSLAQTRQMDLVLRLFSIFWDVPFEEKYVRVHSWKFANYEDFRRGATLEDEVAYNIAITYFDNMGLLYRRKLATLDLLDDLLSGQIILTWQKMAPIVRGYRKALAVPQEGEWFESLCEAMKKRLQAQD